jgi:rRNA processing protein Krr1/Pno1
MSTPIAIEVNCETGDVTERPLTAEEAKAAAKASALAKLAALGLTEEEAAALVGA